MFGPRYFAPRYFGPIYFGNGSDLGGSEAITGSLPCGSAILDENGAALLDQNNEIILDYPLCIPAGGGPARPYPHLRRGHGRSLREICDELERECGFKLEEPAIIVPPEVPLDFEWVGRDLAKLRAETDELEHEARARDADERELELASHARRLIRQLEEEEEMCTILLLSQ